MNVERITSIFLLFSFWNATRGLKVKHVISYLAWMTACRWESHHPTRWRNPQAGLPSHSLHTSTARKKVTETTSIWEKRFILHPLRQLTLITSFLTQEKQSFANLTALLTKYAQSLLISCDGLKRQLQMMMLSWHFLHLHCSESILITSFLTQWKLA